MLIVELGGGCGQLGYMLLFALLGLSLRCGVEEVGIAADPALSAMWTFGGGLEASGTGISTILIVRFLDK